MALISITIPEDLREQLRREPNQSGLIQELLRRHFNISDNPEVLKVKRDQLEKEMKEKLKEFDYKIEIVEKERDTIDKVKKQSVKRVKDKSDSIRKNFKDIAKRDITDTELKEANRRINDPQIDDFNMWAFVEECSL